MLRETRAMASPGRATRGGSSHSGVLKNQAPPWNSFEPLLVTTLTTPPVALSPAGDDLRLLDELQRQRRAQKAHRRIGGVQSIDEELVLRAGGAIEGDADRVGGGSRRQRQHR